MEEQLKEMQRQLEAEREARKAEEVERKRLEAEFCLALMVRATKGAVSGNAAGSRRSGLASRIGKLTTSDGAIEAIDHRAIAFAH